MDDDKAVGMTTDAKPLPLSAEELVNLRRPFIDRAQKRWPVDTIDRLLATIAQKDEQIAAKDAEIAAWKAAHPDKIFDGRHVW